ncbi:MAG: MarR family transcriptional regulator [Bacteroidetes bacterium]|nr:MarR family transcriptional regulator [Bacteroidota bacterium]
MNNIINKSKESTDQVIENLLSIHPLLTKNYTKAIRSKTNLTPGLLFVLGALHHHGKLSMSEIGCHLSVPKPHVTALVDKLIADNLVERLNDPSDRRIIYIQITEKGADDFIAIKKEISQELKMKLELLSKEQLEILSEASQQVKEILMLVLTDHGSTHCLSAEKIK